MVHNRAQLKGTEGMCVLQTRDHRYVGMQAVTLTAL